MHRLLENMLILSLRQDHFRNQTRHFSGRTPPFLIFKISDIFTQTEQKCPYLTPMVTLFRITYASTSRNNFHSEPKTTPILRSHSDVFNIQEQWYFTLSKKDPIRHPWWPVSETRMHRHLENMFILSLRLDRLNN